jgi:hypothetical protein
MCLSLKPPISLPPTSPLSSPVSGRGPPTRVRDDPRHGGGTQRRPGRRRRDGKWSGGAGAAKRGEREAVQAADAERPGQTPSIACSTILGTFLRLLFRGCLSAYSHCEPLLTTILQPQIFAHHNLCHHFYTGSTGPLPLNTPTYVCPPRLLLPVCHPTPSASLSSCACRTLSNRASRRSRPTSSASARLTSSSRPPGPTPAKSSASSVRQQHIRHSQSRRWDRR